MITFAALGLVLRAPPPRLLAEISEEKLELSVTPTHKLGLVLRAPPPRLLAEISEEKLELSVTPTRKLWLAEGSRWPGSQTAVEYHMRALDELVSVEPEDTLKAAAKKMNRAGVSGAPVIDASGAQELLMHIGSTCAITCPCPCMRWRCVHERRAAYGRARDARAADARLHHTRARPLERRGSVCACERQRHIKHR